MVYRTTLTPLFSLRREMDRMLDDAFGAGPARARGAASAWSPAVDIREEPTAWTFEVDLPGVAPEQVEVTAEKGMLTISGEKRTERRDGTDDRWHTVERVHGSFKRTFQLPDDVAEESIEATFANGVLTVRIPKGVKAAARKIEVKKA